MGPWYRVHPRCVSSVATVLSLFLSSCNERLIESPEPVVTNFSLEPNPHNVLSIIATVEATNAERIMIEYAEDSTHYLQTPPFDVRDGIARAVVLGLRPNARYHVRAVAVGTSGGRSYSTAQQFTTAPLPDDLPTFSLRHSANPAPGYVMMGITYSASPSRPYAVIVDNSGRIVWYRRFDGPVADFQRQPDGTYTVFSSLQEAPSHFYQVYPDGRLGREFQVPPPRTTGPHELRLVGDDAYLFGIELRVMNLTQLGGSDMATVRGITVERHRHNQVQFVWSSFDHLSVDEAMPGISFSDSAINPWHGNAIDIDTDGTLLVSFRNASVVVKINSTTGAILWRLGGKKSNFTFVNDPFNGFSFQHGIRRLPNGNIILFDNGNLHTPPTSRAVEYRLDEVAGTATMVWEYRGEPSLYSFALGFAQRLSNGHTVICFGIAQRVLEVDIAGNKTWEIELTNPGHYPYRALRIESLY